jgi:hypothetical protein
VGLHLGHGFLGAWVFIPAEGTKASPVRYLTGPADHCSDWDSNSNLLENRKVGRLCKFPICYLHYAYRFPPLFFFFSK